MKTVLTIAGSDCSGGAGIQADLKTFSAHNHYGMSVITALTAQNTTGVQGILDVSPEFVGNQLDSVFTDIVPDSVKIGMVSRIEIVEVIAMKLKEYSAKNVVLDPVMVATSGAKLMGDDVISALITKLFPLATVITPNILEAQVLSGETISNKEEMVKGSQKIRKVTDVAILVKGGHLVDCADDLLLNGDKISWFTGKRVDNPNTHGTGCTLSSSIACNLASGFSLEESIQKAKNYLSGALESGLDLGAGSGPLNHCWETT
ncbi:MAG: bifunctional hydroxymethylpyrimidine kinase/phosphomethylpyrimidine kinase [Eubacteriales bacterium]